MSETTHNRAVEGAPAIAFTDDQKQLIHGWMNSARAEGVSDAVTAIIGAAAASYFEQHEATDSEAAHLIDQIYGALGAAEEREALAQQVSA